MNVWKILRDPRMIIIVLILILLVIQTIRVERVNPPVQSDFEAKLEIKTLIRGACYNCHSNQTVWPWYSYVAPASWFVAHDVREGRENLNFSEWGALNAKSQGRTLAKIAHKVIEGEMPPWHYTVVHRQGSLTMTNRAQIWAWTLTESEEVEK
jgi:hypothetical protein